jgi:hypothetical protein
MGKSNEMMEVRTTTAPEDNTATFTHVTEALVEERFFSPR